MNSNYNRPEIWEDQLGNFATGGSLYARTPSTELQLLSFDIPSFDAGCGGININFGGFGNFVAQIKSKEKNGEEVEKKV